MHIPNLLTSLLIANPLLLLFLAIGSGSLLGRVRIGSFRLGVAAVLFVGLAFGALHPSLGLPDFVYQLGLVLFVYTIGLNSGGSFFASLRLHGLRDNAMGIALLAIAGLITALLGRLLQLSGPAVAGLFAGSLTNTPALAGVLEALRSGAYGATAELLAEPVVSYSLAYPGGVLGPILAIHLFSSLWQVDFAREAREHGQPSAELPAASCVQAAAEVDFLGMSSGIALGLLVGLVPFPLPGGMSFRLGFAGGPLLVALVLGKLQQSGPLVWAMPPGANRALRELGLMLFLAGIGTRAGYAFASTFKELGPSVLLASFAVTFTYSALTLVLGHKVLNIPMAVQNGLLSGLQTQPAALAYAGERAGSELPHIGYATVYPTAMVCKIILAQLLLHL